MPSGQPTFVGSLRQHVLARFDEVGLAALYPLPAFERDLQALELRLGQLLADVELAHLRGVPLSEAVHLHESYPTLTRMHGSLRDALHMEVPAELHPLVEAVLREPRPPDIGELQTAICVAARSQEALPEERALCRLLLFEGLVLNVFIRTLQTRGHAEAMGCCWHEIEASAWSSLERSMATPLAVDAAIEHSPYHVAVADAVSTLMDRVERAWRERVAGEFHELSDEPMVRDAAIDQYFEWRAALEMALRSADPIDAAVIRNELSPPHVPAVPLNRLALEHPIALRGCSADVLSKHLERAHTKLIRSPRALGRRGRVTLAELIARSLE